ncbi:hypothetical protein Tco_1151157 [Tanacetum coccineum]
MLRRANELHKFSDGTLNKVNDKLDVMLKANVMGYGNKVLEDCKWTRKDKERTESMLIKNEKTLKERRMMRRLKCFVKGRRNETCCEDDLDLLSTRRTDAELSSATQPELSSV